MKELLEETKKMILTSYPRSIIFGVLQAYLCVLFANLVLHIYDISPYFPIIAGLIVGNSQYFRYKNKVARQQN